MSLVVIAFQIAIPVISLVIQSLVLAPIQGIFAIQNQGAAIIEGMTQSTSRIIHRLSPKVKDQ